MCRGGRAVGITTSLWGAGGFGKTMLANAVCARRKVRRHFHDRIYSVTIGRDVRGRAAVAAKVAEVTRFITGDTTEFDDPDLAGAHLGRLLDQRPRTLLVLDDVWDQNQLAPFLVGGRRCVRLVTTRSPALLPPDARAIQVDQMSEAQARSVLVWNLPPLPPALVDALLRASGRWALLLRLINRLIAEQCASGADPVATAERTLHRLRDRGPEAVDAPAVAWNLDDPRQRNQAVKASIEAATTLLPPGGPDRFAELGTFAEDESIPIPVVAQLWHASGGLSEERTRTLCRDLERLSLIFLDQGDNGSVRIHDVVRDYLRSALGPGGLTRTHALLVDAVAARLDPAEPLVPNQPDPGRTWWHLTDSYLLDHLIDHLVAAGRVTLAEAVAGDLRWVESRLAQRGPTAPWTDLTRIDTPHTRPLAHSLAQINHLLSPTEPPQALNNVLHTRLGTHPHWQPQITSRHNDLAQRPCLEALWPLPDAPTPALQRTFTGHSSELNALAISPDGAWLATAGHDNTVRIWDWATASCTTILAGHGSVVTSVAISPDGAWLATTSRGGTLRIWDRATGVCTVTRSGHIGGATSVAISPDGAWLATTSGQEGTVRIWDRATASCTTTLIGHTSEVTSVAISPDGAWIATSSHDRTVRIWDQATASCTAVLTDHTSVVSSVAFSPNGTWLATAGHDKTVRIWDRATASCTAILTGHTSAVSSVAISPDGDWLATTGHDRTVRIWDRAMASCTAVLTGHTSTVSSVAISPNGTWLATTGHDKTVRIWDPSFAQTTSNPSHSGAVSSVAFSRDGDWLATAGRDETVRIWDRATVSCTATLTGHTSTVSSVAISPDGDWLATTGHDRTVRIWDRATRTCTATLTGHTSAVNSVAISPNGAWLASAGHDKTIRIWNRATHTCHATLTGHTSAVNSVAISPSGTWLATTSQDKTMQIWAGDTGVATQTHVNHTSWVSSVAISPDGTWLATAGHDKTVRISNRATASRTGILTGHTSEVTSVAISPDGAWIATTSLDATVRIWRAVDGDVAVIMRAEGELYACAWGPANELAVGGARGLYLLKLRV
ncbi:NB-ARC domain-containing protein [Streptomyces sp. NPDC001927]